MAAALGALVAPIAAQAADVRATTTTIAIGREDPRQGEEVSSFPVFELLALEITDLGVPGFDRSQVVARGWGRLQLGDDEQVLDDAGDLGLFFVEAQSRRLTLRLGRQYVWPGVARMAVVDGLDARADFGGGFSLQGFGGITTPERFEWESGDWQAGTRLAWHAPGQPHEIGASFRHERRGGDLNREEVGLDGYTLVGPAHLTLMAAMAPRETRLTEARLTAGFRLMQGLRLTVDVERVLPDVFLRRDSIFWVFADAAHDALGGDVEWAINPYYSVRLDGHALLNDGELMGSRVSLRATAYRERTHRSFVGGELRRVDEEENAYLRGRLFAGLQVLEDLRLTGDGYAYSFDERINGARNSYLGQLAVAWDPIPQGRLAAAVTAGSTPLASFQLEGLLRFSYAFGANVEEGGEGGFEGGGAEP